MQGEAKLREEINAELQDLLKQFDEFIDAERELARGNPVLMDKIITDFLRQ